MVHGLFFTTTAEVFCMKVRKPSPVAVNLDPQKTAAVSSTGEVLCIDWVGGVKTLVSLLHLSNKFYVEEYVILNFDVNTNKCVFAILRKV